MQLHTTDHFVVIAMSETNVRNLLADYELRGAGSISRIIDGKRVMVAIEADETHYAERPEGLTGQLEIAAELAQERAALEASA